MSRGLEGAQEVRQCELEAGICQPTHLASSPGWACSSDLPGALLAIPVLLGKLALCGLAIVVYTSFAKLRFFRIAEFLGASFLLALVGIATSYVIGA